MPKKHTIQIERAFYANQPRNPHESLETQCASHAYTGERIPRELESRQLVARDQTTTRVQWHDQKDLGWNSCH